jgi:AcrR family transcriptional regulator
VVKVSTFGSRAAGLTREEIVGAALRLIRERGLDRLTMRAVAAELGVTPMAVYHHIADKDELVRLAHEATKVSTWQNQGDPWPASLRRELLEIWDGLAQYPGLGAYAIEQPTLGVTPQDLERGIRFFEEAGFNPTNARLAWSFAMTYIHGRISVDARLGHNPDAPRLDGLHARDYVEFGIDAVIRGLNSMLEEQDGVSDAEFNGPVRAQKPATQHKGQPSRKRAPDPS